MAEIKPFKALRYTKKAGELSSVCCPPYDIISPLEKEAFLSENPYNIIRLELPGTNPEDYKTAGEVLSAWKEGEILKEDAEESLYIYEEEFECMGKTYRMRGITALVKLHEFSDGVVLPHEETLSKAKEDRFNLMCATGCNFSQIYSLYRDENTKTAQLIKKLSSKEPDEEFCDKDGITHRLWIVNAPDDIAAVAEKFADKKLYIADGHHRYETALRYKNTVGKGDSDYCMMFLIDMENDGLVVLPTHRIVKGLENYDTDRLLSACSEMFSVDVLSSTDGISPCLEKAYENGEKAFGFYDGKSAYLLTLKDITFADNASATASEALRRLDVSVLHSLILEKVLKIDRENMAKQINLSYTRSEKEAFSAAQDGANCVFILNPTRISEIAAVAAAGEKMPQKSTYFYPKLITGTVINNFAD